jgi:hypothetical protein
VFVLVKRTLIAAIIAAMSVSLTACDDLDGTVTSKSHKGSYNTTYPLKVGKVTTIQTMHHAECWKVVVSGPAAGSECVDKDLWDSIEVGDHYVSQSS